MMHSGAYPFTTAHSGSSDAADGAARCRIEHSGSLIDSRIDSRKGTPLVLSLAAAPGAGRAGKDWPCRCE